MLPLAGFLAQQGRLGQTPADIAVEPFPGPERSAVQEAVATAALLEEEARRLRSTVHTGLAARLRAQRTFLAGKYQRPTVASALDLS